MGVTYDLLTWHHATNCHPRSPFPGYLDDVWDNGSCHQAPKKLCTASHSKNKQEHKAEQALGEAGKEDKGRRKEKDKQQDKDGEQGKKLATCSKDKDTSPKDMNISFYPKH